MEIAIIGGGAGGLTAIKACLEEGLIPVCYERTAHIGGLWRFTDDVIEGQGCVSRSTITNTSKEVTCFSDYPMPAEWPNYLRHSLFLRYLQLYADHFDLMNHINFNTDVIDVVQAHDFETSGRWNVTTRNTLTSQISVRTFDGVLVCNGHLFSPKIPNLPGISEFRGQKSHSHAFKNEEEFKGQRVVVVGMANSACDMAVDVSRTAEQVYVSTRSGAFVLGRSVANGIPLDFFFNKRISAFVRGLLPKLSEKIPEKFIYDRVYGPFFEDLKPAHSLNGEHVAVNDEFHSRVHCGAIVVKGNIQNINQSGVVFEDGSEEQGIDAILFGTGYHITLPFFHHDVIEKETDRPLLYKNTFLPDLAHPTLAIIGLISTTGSPLPIMELQARWATRVFTHKSKLPDADTMWKSIEDVHVKKERMFTDPRSKNIFVDWMGMMDTLAIEVGCRPNICRLFFTDTKLWTKCYFDACTPYQYRLTGPHPWAGARNAIMTQWDRVQQPYKTRSRRNVQTSNTSWMKMILVILLIKMIIVLLMRII